MHWGINRENKRTGNILSNFLFRPAVRRGGLRVWFFSQSLPAAGRTQSLPVGRQDAKELLRLVYHSRKMEKVGFLCGLPAAAGRLRAFARPKIF